MSQPIKEQKSNKLYVWFHPKNVLFLIVSSFFSKENVQNIQSDKWRCRQMKRKKQAPAELDV